MQGRPFTPTSRLAQSTGRAPPARSGATRQRSWNNRDAKEHVAIVRGDVMGARASGRPRGRWTSPDGLRCSCSRCWPRSWVSGRWGPVPRLWGEPRSGVRTSEEAGLLGAELKPGGGHIRVAHRHLLEFGPLNQAIAFASRPLGSRTRWRTATQRLVQSPEITTHRAWHALPDAIGAMARPTPDVVPERPHLRKRYVRFKVGGASASPIRPMATRPPDPV
jgi:hypothetical protein